MKTYEQCGKDLRAEGYNHVDSNRWGKIEGRKIIFARVVASDNGFRVQKDKAQ